MKLNLNSIKTILDSKVFSKLLEQAAFLLTKNKKLSSLAIAALQKVMKSGSLKDLGLGLIKQVKLLSRLIYFYATGRYTDVTKKSMVIITASIMYFILPIDIIPDFLPGMGYLDDITLIGWVFSTLGNEISTFEEWLNKYNQAETIKYIEIK